MSQNIDCQGLEPYSDKLLVAHRQRKREAKIADKGPGVFKKMHGALRIGVLEEHIGKAKVLAGETQ
eukprot:COSAG06_NODE_36164_length_450_cov_36.054131_2_plen_65_part_01